MLYKIPFRFYNLAMGLHNEISRRIYFYVPLNHSKK